AAQDAGGRSSRREGGELRVDAGGGGRGVGHTRGGVRGPDADSVPDRRAAVRLAGGAALAAPGGGVAAEDHIAAGHRGAAAAGGWELCVARRGAGDRLSGVDVADDVRGEGGVAVAGEGGGDPALHAGELGV